MNWHVEPLGFKTKVRQGVERKRRRARRDRQNPGIALVSKIEPFFRAPVAFLPPSQECGDAEHGWIKITLLL